MIWAPNCVRMFTISSALISLKTGSYFLLDDLVHRFLILFSVVSPFSEFTRFSLSRVCNNMPRSCSIANWGVYLIVLWSICLVLLRYSSIKFKVFSFIHHGLGVYSGWGQISTFYKRSNLANYLNNRMATQVCRMHFKKESRIDIFWISLKKMSKNINKCYMPVCVKACVLKSPSGWTKRKRPNWRNGILLWDNFPLVLTSSWLDY